MAEFATRTQIRTHQLAELRQLLAAVVSGNPFYSTKLSQMPTGGINSLEDFAAHCPFTTKHELVEDQKAHPPYGSNLTFPLERYTRFHQTSGTKGQPLRWLDTMENWDWMVESWRKIFLAAGTRKQDHIYFAFSFGPFIGFWLAFDAAQKLGALCIPGGGLSTEARLRGILDNEVTVVCCTPTYALRLGEVAREQKLDLTTSKVRTIIVAGEPGGSVPATRAAISALWNGASVFDHHGMTETGPVTYQCPVQPGVLHVIESAFLPEIVRSHHSESIPPNEVGELILTTLGRTGSPLLRYRTGDLVKSLEATQCACGSFEMALDGGILGRADDMVIIRGVNVYPTAVEELIRTCGGIAEFRVHVFCTNALPEIKVVIEPEMEGDRSKGLGQKLEKIFSQALSLRVPVEVVGTGTFARFEMKARRWLIETA
jgi:phenylacetate-CoA ligase